MAGGHSISLTYDGDEIIQDVLLTGARFESQANGIAGTCSFSVKDADHVYVPGYFKTGGVLLLTIDGQRVWGGYAMSVTRQYAFPVDDTSIPSNVPRYWHVEGVDWNILLVRRFVFDQADPTKELTAYPGDTPDSEVVLDIAQNYVDLSGDGIDLSGVEHVGDVSAFGMDFKVGNPGQTWGSVMATIALNNGTVFYIDPEKVFHYHDGGIPTAPWIITDRPASVSGSMGCRELTIYSSATEMVNDALVWGAGLGLDQVVFSRTTADDWIANYGRLQAGEFRSDVWRQETVDEIAISIVYGSPTNHRGHVLPSDEVRLALYTPGLEAGMVAEVYSAVFDDDSLYQTVTDPSGTVSATLDNFMARIRKIESNDNYTAQNRSSYAYGAYQIMPGNWAPWACTALSLPLSSGVSSRWIDPLSWYPVPTQANQDAVATYKMSHLYNWLGDWRRVAACWRAGGSVAIRQPAEWSTGTLLYVNHACVPLGFPATTTATVLPPVGAS